MRPIGRFNRFNFIAKLNCAGFFFFEQLSTVQRVFYLFDDMILENIKIFEKYRVFMFYFFFFHFFHYIFIYIQTFKTSGVEYL